MGLPFVLKISTKSRTKKTQPAAANQPTADAESGGASASSGAGKDADVKVYMYIPGCKERSVAVFNRSNGHMDVLGGSFVRIATFDSLPHHIKDRREKLLASGDLVVQNGQVYVLKQVVSFSSPTAAAEFVLGRSASGPREWKDSRGVELGDLFPGCSGGGGGAARRHDSMHAARRSRHHALRKPYGCNLFG